MCKQKAIMKTKQQQHTQYAQNLYQAVDIKYIKYTFKNILSKKLQALLVIGWMSVCRIYYTTDHCYNLYRLIMKSDTIIYIWMNNQDRNS